MADSAICAAILACIAQQGIDPNYVHRFEASPPEAEFIYDGTLNEAVLEALRFCAIPIKVPVKCEYHADDQK